MTETKVTNNLIIGIDLGVSGSGIAVKDKNEDKFLSSVIIKHDLKTEDGRQTYGNIKRGRRPRRRKILRSKDFANLCSDYGFSEPSKDDEMLLHLKNKALYEKVEESHLIMILRNYITHRGSANIKDYSEKDKKDEKKEKEYQTLVNNNQKYIDSGMLPCEIQLMNYEKVGAYRGNKVVLLENKEKHLVMNTFSRSFILEEIKRILNTQSIHYEKLTEEFITSYIKLFSRMRSFTVGPGNEKSRTDNGIYTTKKDPLTGKYITLKTNVEKMVGKCSLFIEERRASKASFSAQKYNLWNDLMNMRVSGKSLNEDERKLVYDGILKSTDGENINIRSIVSKLLGISDAVITGVGVKKEKKEYKNVYHSMACYRELVKTYTDAGISFDYSENQIDEMMGVVNINSVFDTMKEELLKINEKMTSAEFELLFDFKMNHNDYFGWHAYSLKALRFFNEKMTTEGMNPYNIEREYNLSEEQLLPFMNKERIPLSVLNDITNPVVQRNLRHIIKYINRHIKDHGYPETFVIEAARDYNTEKEKERIEDIQAQNRGAVSRICNEIFDKYGVKITSKHFSQHKKLGLKLKLWDEQGGHCPYSLSFIHPGLLILNPDDYEVDHIIPYVLSLDNSRNNIVLVESQSNGVKGIRSPLSYVRSGEAFITEKEFRKNIKDTKFNKVKKANLLTEADFMDKYSREGFLNSHLNNTRYMITLLSDILRKYFKANNIDSKIVTMSSKVVTGVRNSLNIEKDRAISDDHHAVDAMIMLVAYERLKKVDETYSGLVNYTTGKIYSYNRMYELRHNVMDILREYNTDLYKKMVLEASDNILYKDYNKRTDSGKLFDDTSYGTRIINGEHYVVSKFSDIYEHEGLSCAYKSLLNKMEKNKDADVLMYHYDPQTYAFLKKIAEDYDVSKFDTSYKKEHGLNKNPFYNYKVINGHPIYKQNNKSQNIPIYNLKVASKKLGIHQDLSHKIGHKNGDKKLVKLSLTAYRTDIYYNKENKSYHAVGIKLVDLKYHPKGNYISEERYLEFLRNENILNENQGLEDIKETHYEFRFSLYAGDSFKMVNAYEQNESLELIFQSKMQDRKDTIKFKIRDQKYKDLVKNIKYGDEEKIIEEDKRTLKNVTKLVKINKDVKGNSHYAAYERLKNVGMPLKMQKIS